jgi:hypothetical protein
MKKEDLVVGGEYLVADTDAVYVGCREDDDVIMFKPIKEDYEFLLYDEDDLKANSEVVVGAFGLRGYTCEWISKLN